MKRQRYQRYIILCAVLFALVSLPSFFVESIRTNAMGFCAWISRGSIKFSKSKSPEIERLEGENHLLRMEIGKLRSLLEQREKVAHLTQELKMPELAPRRCDEIRYLLGVNSQSVPASVIYRDPGNWSSTLWVNVGTETNRQLKKEVIQKNSPVILGRSAVGAIDYVGKNQSRIRLITDFALTPSVRAVRGFQQNMHLIENVDAILRQLTARTDLPLTTVEKNTFKTLLESLKENVSTDAVSWHLAKGVLQGTSTPLARSVNHTLRGIGFNYDFPDEEGPARELLTGKVVNDTSNSPPIPILRVGDLLVTTGMDGLFPPGLRIAEVTRIFPTREGAYTYDIEAAPTVGNLDTLQTVFIIPPVGYSQEESMESEL